MEDLIVNFWNSEPWKPSDKKIELECRFGYMSPFSKLDYDNAVKKIKSLGFSMNQQGYLLRVNPLKPGEQSMPNRAEIKDVVVINNYLEKKQTLQEILKTSESVTFETKEYYRDSSFNAIKPILVPDYNFKLSYNVESPLEKGAFLEMSARYEKKIFRLINRLSFRRQDFPFVVEFSIIETVKGTYFKREKAEKTYEIEIEVVNEEIQHLSAAQLVAKFRKIIVYILCGIQQSNFHISMSEAERALASFSELVGSKKFIGQNCQTIQLDTDIVSTIYCVTEKADGERHLLYIGPTGKIYLIQQRMQILFTGCCVKHKKYFDSVLDGELILHTKDGSFINMFAIFDVLFLLKKDVRRVVFKDRFKLLKDLVDDWSPHSVTGEADELPMIFVLKRFLFPDDDVADIHSCCSQILDSTFLYPIDGLIFTPVYDNQSVLLKWKFEKQNTIDFKVVVASESLLALHCGYTPTQLLSNPKQLILNDEKDVADNTTSYTVKLFVPTNPYNEYAGYASVNDMKTQSGESFGAGDIVEFAYLDAKWVPVKIRKDKTMPNNFQTANMNWTFIHFPVTEEMIRTGMTEKYPAEDVYYNRGDVVLTKTKELRDFHNHVKRELLHGSGPTLIDFGCGRAGDLHKWIHHKITMVFGIDRNEDNVVNQKDGCYARYLPQRKRLLARFVHGDATKPLEDLKKSELEIWQSFKTHIFDTASCQFAIHYFFQNEESLRGFLINLCNTVKLGGRFVGCCFDGRRVFEKLRAEKVVNCNDEDGKRMWCLQRNYKKEEFPDDVESLGYKITVFQESINTFQEEYLVNFDFFHAAMEQIGFFPIQDESFEHFYKEDEFKMTPNQKELSFLNRAFVFEKKTKILKPEMIRL